MGLIKTNNELNKDRFEIKAYAKINLALNVIGRRDNGYHDLRMIMQTIGVYDELSFVKTESSDITMTCSVQGLPTDDSNLVIKAAKLMFKTYDIKGGLKIHLDKRIPAAAGLAGGSTDAAAVFKAINYMYDLSASLEDLQKLGVTLGADIPYCIIGGTALAEGIGEELTKLPTPPSCHILLVKPDVNVSTKYVYEHIDNEDPANLSCADIEGMIDGLYNSDMKQIVSCMGNDLAKVTEKEYTRIGDLKRLMTQGGAIASMMSGSGPSVYGFFDNLEAAEQTAETIGAQGLETQIFVTEFV